MNEAQTRFNKIDPKLRDAGWGIVPGSNILVEQSAYIAPGRITTTGNKNPKKADYILEYKGMKLAVIEAKSDEKDVSEGVAQAKLYADALKIRYTYSTNGDEFVSLGEYINKLFGRIPEFFSDADDLREKWSNPETREKLLQTLDEAGFAEEKLLLLKNMLKMQKFDLLDVLEYIAYESTPIERAKRVELVKKKYVDKLNKEQREFDNLILPYYANNGFKELGTDNLKTFITIKFNSMSDAKERLQMSVADIRAHYFELQRRLYRA